MGAEDGVMFRPDTIQAAEIRKDANYAGIRITLLGLIDAARCPIQIDIGFGDAVTPGPEEALYPVMLPDFQAPRLQVYPRYTVVAEKLEAITALGIANSRMKDFFDLWILLRHTNFDGDILRRAIQATFVRRKTTLPADVPFGLTDDFARDTQKQTQWHAFVRRNRLEALQLEGLVAALVKVETETTATISTPHQPSPSCSPPSSPLTRRAVVRLSSMLSPIWSPSFFNAGICTAISRIESRA